MQDEIAERSALVALLLTRPGGRTWRDITEEVLDAGDVITVWQRHMPPTLLRGPGEPDPLEEAEATLATWAAQGLRLVTILDPDYPARLRAIHQAPPLLFARGELRADDRAVSVVGSRRASEHGLAVADSIARALVAAGYSVASGLAAGIDTAAHRATLASGGRPVGVIGTGINRLYPASSRKLHEAVAARGLLLSQFLPDAPPQRHSFLMRNATMSGYGVATVVVEAGETSGARAQARMAIEHGRPVLLTDLVVNRNEWAQTLTRQPLVRVVSNVQEVLTALQDLDRQRAHADELLRDLVSA